MFCNKDWQWIVLNELNYAVTIYSKYVIIKFDCRINGQRKKHSPDDTAGVVFCKITFK